MELDVNTLILLITTLGGLAGAIFTQKKYATAKDKILEVIGDISDLLAMVYAMKTGACDADTLQKIIKKVEEVWTDIGSLGPSFAELLAQKSSLANAISQVSKSEQTAIMKVS
jgi:hypothetical protein